MDDGDLHGRWRIVEVAGDDVADATGAEVEFSATADVTGSTGVNRFRARYTVVGDVLRVTPLAMTRMAGPPEAMAREHAIEGASTPGLRLRRLGPGAPTAMVD